MTKRYPGGYITKTPPTVSTTSAPGIWTMEQQAAYQKAGTWPFGGPFTYIEDVFSTYLYTGTGSSGLQIQNGIDLAGKGGLVIGKARSGANAGTVDWGWIDTARGGSSVLYSNATNAAAGTAQISSFNADGFTLNGAWPLNYYGSPYTYGSWTFRKQPKFFDVVTYTGTGSTQTINHNLGSVPGCIIVKATSIVQSWPVYHRSLGGTDKWLVLDRTDGVFTNANQFGSPTDTTFTVVSSNGTNGAGVTYVAYLFAHNAGGFGASGADNVISCGSFTENGSTQYINLGYEPQWIMTKLVTGNEDWIVFDNMRGWSTYPGPCNDLNPNASAAEGTINGFLTPTSTGFRADPYAGSGNTYIYIAIRRGPMKTPTTGTSVFSPNAVNGPTDGTQVTTNFPVDLSIWKDRDGSYSPQFQDRLRGLSNAAGTGTPALYSDSTAAESSNQTGYQYWNTGFRTYSSGNNLWATFRRAPGFFDEVCYTGTGSSTTQTHNLGVTPEMMIVKYRTPSGDSIGWAVYHSALGNGAYIRLDASDATTTSATAWNNTTPTSSVFTVGTSALTNASTYGYVAYLFASCPGVSKVGSYSGNGATQTISCGFAARFVLIKRTNTSGTDWWYWTTASGMVAGTDNRLSLNSTASQTNSNWVYTDASGFQIVTNNAGVNASGGTYIYLAIA